MFRRLSWHQWKAKAVDQTTLPLLDLFNRHRGGLATMKLGYGGAGPACSRADTHYPPRASLSSAACTPTHATRRPWKCPASDTMTDYAADCLSHERRDTVIYLIGRPRFDRRISPNSERHVLLNSFEQENNWYFTFKDFLILWWKYLVKIAPFIL